MNKKNGMHPIITVTVNPCIDISAKLPAMIPDRKLHCTDLLKEPGGGGVNISRVIKRFGDETKAVYLCGGYTGDFFTSLLQKENIDTYPFPIINHTRENMAITDEFSGLQYRIGLPGPQVFESEWKGCLEKIKAMPDPPFIVASGSLTDGVPVDFFARIAEIAKAKNAKFILDTAGEPLKTALEQGVYLIKPNLGELSAYNGRGELNKPEAIELAKELIKTGKCEVIVISMAAAGALLVTQTFTEHITAPFVKVKSVVGAGDSMVAGITWSLLHNKCLKDAVRFGVACGTASAINEGTGLCKPDDAMRLYASMNLDY